MRIILITLALIVSLGIKAGADPFFVEGNIIFFDTENSSTTDEIEFGQRDQLLQILKKNMGIDTLVLNSGGGMIDEAKEIADLVIDVGLNTHVELFCESACVTIFLAGKNRTLALGGKIGFHASWWDATSMEKYYQSEKQDKNGRRRLILLLGCTKTPSPKYLQTLNTCLNVASNQTLQSKH